MTFDKQEAGTKEPTKPPFDRCACGYSNMACEATKAGGLHDLRVHRKTNPTLEAFQ